MHLGIDDAYYSTRGGNMARFGSTDFAGGRWDGVDEVLRGVYEEASENLGQEFPYPADD